MLLYKIQIAFRTIYNILIFIKDILLKENISKQFLSLSKIRFENTSHSCNLRSKRFHII